MASFAAQVYGRDVQAQDDKRKMQLAPLQQAISADQQRLSTMKEGTPEYENTLQSMAVNIGRVRNIYGDKTPADHPSRLAQTVDAIRSHLGLGGKNPQAAQDAKLAKFNAGNTQMAQEYATGAINPLEQEMRGLTSIGLSPEQARHALFLKLGILPKDTTEQERFVSRYMDEHPGSTEEQALGAYTKATKAPTAANMPTIVNSGQVPFGVKDPTAGKTWTEADIKSAPPAIQSMWRAAQNAYKSKLEQQEKVRKEEQAEIEKRQRITNSMMLKRMSLQFQNALSLGGFRAANSVVQKLQQTYDTSTAMESKMKGLEKIATDAIKHGHHDQQAELAILANHIAMTTHQAGASMRPTKALFDEAAAAQPWLQKVTKSFDTDGYLTGVVLSPQQIQQMVELAPVMVQGDKDALDQARQQLNDQLNPTPAGSSPSGPVHQKNRQAQKQQPNADLANRLDSALGGK